MKAFPRNLGGLATVRTQGRAWARVKVGFGCGAWVRVVLGLGLR